MPLNHTHQLYDNKVIAFKVENQLKSLMDHMQFCTVDNSLQGVAGDHITTYTYSATDNKTQVLEMGEGNTSNIEVKLVSEDHKIKLLQNRFPYYDEELMNDPKAIEVGLNHQAVDMFNKINDDIMTEFAKAKLECYTAKFDFAAFADAASMFGRVEYEGGQPALFALVNKKDVAAIRKELGESLKYVEAFVRTGYVGTVAGINIYTDRLAEAGTITLATKKAVKVLVKTGVGVEQDRSANDRLTKVYTRKYIVPYFADVREAVKIIKGNAPTFTEVENPQKAAIATYYEKVIVDSESYYEKTTDTDVVEGKKYYTKG